MSISNKTKELAQEIIKSDEYIMLVETKEKLDNDKVATTLLNDMNILQKEYIKTIRENLDKDAIKSMENILRSKHEELLENEIAHNYIKTKNIFDKMIKSINKQLSEAIQIKKKDN